MILIFKKINIFYSSVNMLATWAKDLTLKIGLVEKSTFLFLHVYVWLVCLCMYTVWECMHTEPRVVYLLY